MANFAPGYVSDVRRRWDADDAAEKTRFNSPPYVGLYIGQPEAAKAALDAWEKEHPMPTATLAQVADHIDHLRAVAGVDHVGLGSDFDGIEDAPVGLEGVNCYPALLAELMRRGWTDADIAKLAGGNVLRVMADVERVAATLHDRPPSAAVWTASPAALK
jgi:membrane dipeptidase